MLPIILALTRSYGGKVLRRLSGNDELASEPLAKVAILVKVVKTSTADCRHQRS